MIWNCKLGDLRQGLPAGFTSGATSTLAPDVRPKASVPLLATAEVGAALVVTFLAVCALRFPGSLASA